MFTQEAKPVGSLELAARPMTVGEMVVADYRKAEVFRKFGIDYCCGGKKPLEEVCLKKGVDPQAVREALAALADQPAGPPQAFDSMELDALAQHIVHRHHAYVTEALPMLHELTEKVARVHGERHPELVEIAQRFRVVSQELQMHMRKEEHVLFPQITKMAVAQRTGGFATVPFFGSVASPIRMMEAEHEAAGDDMAEIRRLSSEYTPPADACTSYRVLFAKLAEFEEDLHQHVHLENNILFPKAIALENTSASA